MPSWEIKLHAQRSELVIYTQPFSFFCTLHIHISKKEHVTFIGKQHLVCSPLSLQNSVPSPPLGCDVFLIKLQIHSAFPELFIRHLSPPRYLLHHNSAPKFRRYIKTLHSGPRWWLLPFFGSKAKRLKEAVPAPCLVLYYHKDSVKVAQNTQCDMI